MRIIKVGHKKGETFIHTEEEKNGEILKSQLESDAPALPEFNQALHTLGAHMADIMGFPKNWKWTCLSTSINHEEDDRLGAVVTLYVDMPKFNQGITINTPHLREKVQGAPGGGAFMTPDMLEMVKAVVAEGQKYMDGERAQQTLLDKEGDGEE